MNTSLLLFVSFLALGSASRFSRARRQADSCPLIFAKDASQCVGRISECWSPGQYDVDCDNGAGLCCFDGCVNVCDVPKVCKTVYETKYENFTREVCTTVPQEPVCVPETYEDCNEECKIVNDEVPETLVDEVCNTVTDTICVQIEVEQCLAPELVTSCPVIPLKPASECGHQPGSTCWSPGVLDVDCDNGMGLCCFDGCSNQCVKNCKTEEEQVCRDIEVEKCDEVPSKVCDDVSSPVQVPMITKVCNAMDQSCMTMSVLECPEGDLDNCREVPQTKCTEATPEDCETSTTYVEKELVFNKCRIEYNTVCDKVPDRECNVVTKEVCPDCVPTKVPSQKCEDVPREVCQDVYKTVTKIVPRNDCQEVCTPRVETKCTTPEPKTECKPVHMFKSYQVPVSVCV